jgi:hypothetical protein
MFVVLQDAAKKQRIADAVASVMKPAMRSRESGSGAEKRMYEGALQLVETFHMVAEAVVRETLGLPDDILIGTTLCGGYPERPFGPVSRKPVSEVIHWDGW